MCKTTPLGLFFPFQCGQVFPWVTTQQDNWVMSNFPHLELGPRVLGLQVVEDCSWLLFNRLQLSHQAPCCKHIAGAHGAHTQGTAFSGMMCLSYVLGKSGPQEEKNPRRKGSSLPRTSSLQREKLCRSPWLPSSQNQKPTEYPTSEAPHKDHQVPLLAPQRTTQNSDHISEGIGQMLLEPQ